MRTNLKVRSGNRIVVVFDGTPIGLIQNVSMNDDFGLDAASGIGDIHVQEHVPSMARHSLSVSRMVMFKDLMEEKGITGLNGDAALEGLVFDFEAYGKDEGELLRKYISCSYASGSLEVSKHAIVMASAQFMALDVQ